MTTIDKNIVRRHFDRHADEYDRYAGVQRHMAARLMQGLSEVPEPAEPPQFRKSPEAVRSILEIGCGTGFLTEMLLRRYPEARLTAVDLSSAMIGSAVKRLGPEARRVRFLEADAEELLAGSALEADRFDLIISNATFQWFNRPSEAISRCLELLLRPDGTIAFATFGPRTFYELHASFRAAEDALQLPRAEHGQTFISAEEWKACFSRPGDLKLGHEERVETFSSVADFLHSVKRVGAGNANHSPSRGAGSAGRRLFAEMQQVYRDRFGFDGIIPATYEIFFVFYRFS